MATVPQKELQASPATATDTVKELKIYSHSSLMYWWPIWLVGYLLAILTALQGETVSIGGRDYLMHPSKNLGVFYTVVFVLVILFTNVSMRGLVSLVVVISVLFFTVLFAWLDWWDDILALLPYLAIHMNLGFYIFFSTAIFLVWALAFFVFDRMHFWRIRPGQMTYERFIGGGEISYDTRNMVLEKRLEDLFRHHILGLGSGDLLIMTSGARSEKIDIPNVVFIDRTIRQAQRLIAIKPDEAQDRTVAAGTPG
jgi:hypothetical protein